MLEEGEAIEETVEWRHRPTHPLDEDGQGDAHVQYAFSAHRAVVDVDTELGLVRVVELATAQEVGQGHEPAGARGPDRGRQRAGPRPRAARGDPDRATARSSTRPSPTTCCRRSSTCRRCASRCSSTPTPRRRTASRASASRPTSPRRPPSPRRCATPPGARWRASRCAPSTSSGSTPRRRFVARYGALFEHSPWVARGGVRRAARSRASTTCTPRSWRRVREAPRERQLALIRAHPELAGREAQAGELTAASAGEQASAGLRSADRARRRERWRALNRAYRERFDFPLVVCVREHTKASILAWGEERLGHDARARRSRSRWARSPRSRACAWRSSTR